MCNPKNRKSIGTRHGFQTAIMTVALLCAGCKHYNAINFVTNTQFGIKLGVNSEKIPEIAIGYNRQEAARVPVYLMTSEDELPQSAPAVNAILAQAKTRIDDAGQYAGGTTTTW